MAGSRSAALWGLGTLAFLACGNSPALAQEQPVPQVIDGKLQRVKDGWPSGPLTLIVNDKPGTTNSLFATALVSAAEKISPVPLRIDHRPDFSTYKTWEAQAWMERQGQKANDGSMILIYTAPGNVADLVLTDMKTEAGVDLSDIKYVNMMEELPYFIHQRANAPWGDTLDDLIAYARKNPNTVRYISGGPGTGQDAAMQWYMNKLGFTAKSIISGSSSERALAVAAGDGDITVSPPDVLLPHSEGKRVRALMIGGKEPATGPWAGVPSAADRGIQNDPWGTNRGMQVTKLVPESHRLWLETLFREAARDKDYIANRSLVPGIRIRYRGGEETMAYMRDAYEQALPIMQSQGLYWKDKK